MSKINNIAYSLRLTPCSFSLVRSSRLCGQLILFALLLTVYTLTNAGGFHIVDEVSLFAVTESLAQRGAVDTNAIAWSQWVNSPGEVLGAFGPDGEVYSKKGPAPAFISVPWYTGIRFFATLGLPWGLLQGTLLWNGVITAATAVLLWLAALRLGYSERTGAALALLFGLGTIAWPYANHLFGEPLSAFSLLLCFYGLISFNAAAQRERGAEGERAGVNTEYAIQDTQHALRNTHYLWLAGIGAGVAVATVTAHILLIALFGLYLIVFTWRASEEAKRESGRVGEREIVSGHASHITYHESRTTHYSLLITHYLLPFILPILFALLLLAWYNVARFGHPLDTGYHFDSGEGFTTSFRQGFWGLMGSPYRGIFWHTPLFLASILTFPLFLRRHRAEGLLLAALSAVLIALYSTWWMWWGGFAWGPRFLVPLTPFWVLPLAPVVARIVNEELRTKIGKRRRLVLPILYSSFFMLSFWVQLSAVLVNYVNYEIELRQFFPTDWVDPLRFGPPAQSIADLRFSPVFGQWRLITQDFSANTDIAWLWADGTVLWPVVVAGALALILLIWAFVRWWRSLGAADQCSVFGVRRRLSILATGLHLLVIAVWLSSVGSHPRYGEPDSGYRAILAEVGAHAGDDNVLLTVAPYHYQIPMNWSGGLYRGGFPIYGYATDSVAHPEAVQVLTAVLQSRPHLWFVTAGLPPAEPSNLLERWLADHAYKADDRWFGDFRLVRYATAMVLHSAPPHPLNVTLADEHNQIEILRVQRPATAASGTLLPLEIRYQIKTVAHPLRWFVQLLEPEGQPVALLDTAPVDGYAAFTDLPTGEELVERVALVLPAGLAAGEYQLIAGIYAPSIAGAPRLHSGTNGDFIDLGKVVIP